MVEKQTFARTIEIDDMREREIALHGLQKADAEYTFYYDETNNVRRFHFDERGFNVAELKVFVLGGIVHQGPPQPIDLQRLREELNIQPTADEIKLKHIAKGEFLDLLQSQRLGRFLEWVQHQGFYIHYHQLDPLYWSLVDIIDSIIPELGDKALLMFNGILKSDLCEVMKADLASTVQLFHQFDYPGLKPGYCRPFLQALTAMLDRQFHILPKRRHTLLRKILSAGSDLPSLDLIEDFEPGVLIDEFSAFYLGRLTMFKNAHHIFDDEDRIREGLERVSLVSDGKPVQHYRFANSKNEPGIQMSDVLAGLIGKMHSYLRETPRSAVVAQRDRMSSVQLRNASLLRNMIDSSDAENKAFFQHVSRQHDIDKLSAVLHFSDSGFDY